jgi:hypothetical protein
MGKQRIGVNMINIIPDKKCTITFENGEEHNGYFRCNSGDPEYPWFFSDSPRGKRPISFTSLGKWLDGADHPFDIKSIIYHDETPAKPGLKMFKVIIQELSSQEEANGCEPRIVHRIVRCESEEIAAEKTVMYVLDKHTMDVDYSVKVLHVFAVKFRIPFESDDTFEILF